MRGGSKFGAWESAELRERLIPLGVVRSPCPSEEDEEVMVWLPLVDFAAGATTGATEAFGTATEELLLVEAV